MSSPPPAHRKPTPQQLQPAGGALPRSSPDNSSPRRRTSPRLSTSPSPATPTIPADEDGGEGEEEEGGPDLPMTMAASVILTSLPKDAHQALERAGEVAVDKVTVRFRAVGSAPTLRQPVAKVSSSSRFETVVRFLRRRLGVQDHESVFCYVNSVFAPGLDEGVGNLWRCFKTKDELVVAYSITPAFG